MESQKKSIYTTRKGERVLEEEVRYIYSVLSSKRSSRNRCTRGGDAGTHALASPYCASAVDLTRDNQKGEKKKKKINTFSFGENYEKHG